MTSRHSRIVGGYPFYACTIGASVLAANASLVLTCNAGPGEILGFGMLRYAGSHADYALLWCNIVIDGVTRFDNYLGWLCGTELDYAFHNLFATLDIHSSTITSFSFKFLMSYESTAVITFTNKGAASISIGVAVHTHQGA